MNTQLNFKLLKRLYDVHSPSSHEEKMTRVITAYIKSLPGRIKVWKDKHGNLYARKGEAENFPCLVAHLDQVQKNHSKDFRSIETRDLIFGYSQSNRRYEGLGADDKNGIFICLEALNTYDAIKVAMFREEEIGCLGSSDADMSFFDDVRFVVQCDRRGNSDMITSISSMDLCSEDFIREVAPEQWGYSESCGMMTDIEILKENGLAVSATNLSCAYYDPHSDHEHTSKRDLEKCWRMVRHIIEDCTRTYPHTPSYAGSYGIYDYELEDEIHQHLDYNPLTTADELLDAYGAWFPKATRSDFQNIIDEHRQLYDEDGDDDLIFDTYGKENDNRKAKGDSRV